MALRPLHNLIAAHVMAAERLHGDDTLVRVLAKGKTDTDLDARCARDRERVGAFLGAAREVERERRGLDGAGPAGRQPSGDGWEKKALAAAAEGGAIRAEIPPRHLTAHLAFFGAGPDGVAEEEKKIRERIERDRQAREAAEAAARAAREARMAEESRRIRDEVRAQVDAVRERLELSRELRDCLGEREAAGKAQYVPFYRREEYPNWLSRAGALLEKADRHLDAAQKHARGPEDEREIETLRDLTGALRGALREDREKTQSIETERAREQSRQRDRSRDRGFSM